MSIYRIFFLAFVLTGLFSLKASSQPDTISINHIVQKTQQLTQGKPIEKVYVQFDKPYYAVGDTIWFKAYVTGNLHMPSALSHVVYLDVTNTRDSLVQTLRIPVREGGAPGHLILNPLLYKEGNYQFRAYTRYMLNFSNAYFFNKSISIGNTINKELLTHVQLDGQRSEKGAKVSARVLFKDNDGKPLAGRRVNWRMFSKFDTWAEGRGLTDQNGYLSISNTFSEIPERLPDLETRINMSDQQVISRIFPLRQAFNKPDMQFFPEGGKLLSSVLSKVAFKAIRFDGMGIDAKGELTDESGKVVARFASQHLGMGAFEFSPEASKSYKANVSFADGTKATYELPKPRTSSVGLALRQDSSSVLVRISSTSAYLERHLGEPFYLVARSNNVLCYAAQTKLMGAEYTASIPLAKFPTGITQFTLFSPTGSVVSERLVFINRKTDPSLNIASDKAVYTTKQKVRLSLNTSYAGSPLPGNYSIAVLDESKVPYDEEAEVSIKSSLLLTSDLNGYVEKPNYYFIGQNAKKAADLDVLMLTQGYRAYTYRDILDDKVVAPVYMPEQSMEISGTLRMKNGMAVNRGTVQLIIPDRNFSASAQTNADGQFKFDNLIFPDSTKVILSARSNTNSSNMMMVMNGEVLPGVTPGAVAQDQMLNIDSSMNAYLSNSKKVFRTAVVLQDVVIKSTRPIPKKSHKDYPALSGLSPMADYTMMGDRLSGCAFLLDCLRTGTMGMTFDNGNFYVTRDYNAGNRTPAQVFVNGMPVDVMSLNGISSKDVESIEIFVRDDLGTVNRTYNSNGVIAINTKETPKGQKVSLSQLQDMLPKTNLINFTPMGYIADKQFYSPKYTVNKSGPVVNDLRSTIYWNPVINIDESGKAAVEFFNADGRGPYKAVVEGIDKDGNIIRSVFRYNVK